MPSSLNPHVSSSPCGEPVDCAEAPSIWSQSLDATKSSPEWQEALWRRWSRYQDWPGYLDVYEAAAYLRISPKFLRDRMATVMNSDGKLVAALPHHREGRVYRIGIRSLETLGLVGALEPVAQTENLGPKSDLHQMHPSTGAISRPVEPISLNTQTKKGRQERLSENARKSTAEWQHACWHKWAREEDWPGYLDVYEAAAFRRVSPKVIRGKLVSVPVGRGKKAPKLPHNHLGRIYRIRKDQLQRCGAVGTWIERAA